MNYSNQLSSKDKFRVVLEAAALDSTGLAEYCFNHGIPSECIISWRNDFEQVEVLQRRIRDLEQQLIAKEAALASATAQLAARKRTICSWKRYEED